MRIIGGRFGGRKFSPPKKTPARPTTDVAKEGLFNMLDAPYDFSEMAFLDLFAGTGSISYEFASRGGSDITMVEKAKINIDFIKRTCLELKIDPNIHQEDVFRFIERNQKKYSMIFAGPPYPLPNLASIPEKVLNADMLTDDGFFIMEHNPNHNFENAPRFLKTKNYGSTIFSIFI